jgi:hypothetical protein
MLKTSDIMMIVIMAVAATVTYSIKHNAENRLEEVHQLDAQIKQEEETIDLLKADWALLTQPNRLSKLAKKFKPELQLDDTRPDQLVLPVELPKMRAELTVEDLLVSGSAGERDGSLIPVPEFAARQRDAIVTGAVE